MAVFLVVVLRLLGDEGIAGQQQGRDRSGVLQCGASHLGRVDDAALHEVFVLAGRPKWSDIRGVSSILNGTLAPLTAHRVKGRYWDAG